MAKVRVRDVSLEVHESGTGTPLILVHGSVSDYRTWSHQRSMLSRHFRTITYSRRFHWPNPPITAGTDYSMLQQVEDLDALVSAVGAEPAHVAGHSYGAYLALLFAIRSPDKVRSLVLAEPPLLPLFVSIPPKPIELLRLLLTRPRTAAAIVRFGAKGMGPATAAFERGDPESALRTFGTAVLGKEAFDGLSAERLEQVRANLIKEEFLGSGFAPLIDAEIQRIGPPTLLLGAERSPSLFGLLLDRLHELIPHARRAGIPSASHIMHEDNPDAFFEHVVGFLGPG